MAILEWWPDTTHSCAEQAVRRGICVLNASPGGNGSIFIKDRPPLDFRRGYYSLYVYGHRVLRHCLLKIFKDKLDPQQLSRTLPQVSLDETSHR